jgi:hypothetical protein
MLLRAHSLLVFLIFAALILTIPALAQVEPSATGNPGGSLDESEMMTPPPVSGLPYANTAGSETRSNYLAANVTVSPSYIDNVLPSNGSTPVSDFVYSISPSVSLDRTAPRQKEQFSYSPSFTFYEPTSALDSVDQNAAVGLQYRFNPKVAVSLEDSFSRTSNVYNSSYVFSNTVTGSTLTPAPTVIAPFAEQMINTASGVLGYQFGLNAMIGGGGSFTTFDLPNPANASGLYNSHGSRGLVFYSRRLSRSQYTGLAYQYDRTLAYPASGVSETQTHSLLPFYTYYFNRAFSASISVGIERVDATAPQSPVTTEWSPSVTASAGWQGNRGILAAGFSHTVTAGQGLLGAYSANSISGSGGWKLARTWSGGLSVGYTSINSVTPLTLSSFQGGNTLTAGVSVEHPIGERLSASFQYQHLHETYSGVAVITANPDSNREAVTLTYKLSRPLGR